MTLHWHAWVRWNIHRSFQGRGNHRRLLAQLSRCARCRAYHARLHAAEAALCGVPAGSPTPFALERLGQALFEVRAPQAPPAPRWAFALAAAAAVLLVVWALPRSVPEWSSRGSHDDAAAKVGLRLFKVSERAAVETSALRVGETLAFSASNAGETPLSLAVVGEEKGALRWYVPATAEAPPPLLRAHTVDEPLEASAQLDRAGPLRLWAIFSPAPLPPERLLALVKGAAAPEGVVVQVHDVKVAP